MRLVCLYNIDLVAAIFLRAERPEPPQPVMEQRDDAPIWAVQQPVWCGRGTARLRDVEKTAELQPSAQVCYRWHTVPQSGLWLLRRCVQNTLQRREDSEYFLGNVNIKTISSVFSYIRLKFILGGVWLSKIIQSEARLFTRNIEVPGAGFEYVMFIKKTKDQCVCIFQAGHLLEGPPGWVHWGWVKTSMPIYCIAFLNVGIRC